MIKPNGYWNVKENRVKETIALYKKLGKPPSNITSGDFRENRLGSLLTKKGGPANLLHEAGLIKDFGEMRRIPRGHWKNKPNRVKKIREFVEKTGKDPQEINSSDFKTDNKAYTILRKYYNGSSIEALKDAGYEIDERKRKRSQSHWRVKSNRIEDVRRLVEKLGLPPRSISKKHFEKNGLGGLLAHHYGNSIYRAFREAGYAVKKWEFDRVPNKTWQEKKNRYDAVVWLLSITSKEPHEINKYDFKKKRLWGLLTGNPYRTNIKKVFEDLGIPRDPEKSDHSIFKKDYPPSNHGHTCDSLAELEIDNELEKRGLLNKDNHEHHKPYPFDPVLNPNKKYTCDWVVYEKDGKEYWFEFAGCEGMTGRGLGRSLEGIDTYSDRLGAKRKIAEKEPKIDLTIISVKDFQRGVYPIIFESKLGKKSR